MQFLIFRRWKYFFENLLDSFLFDFSSFSTDFGEARDILTSKSHSSEFFALDGQLFRSIRSCLCVCVCVCLSDAWSPFFKTFRWKIFLVGNFSCKFASNKSAKNFFGRTHFRSNFFGAENVPKFKSNVNW